MDFPGTLVPTSKGMRLFVVDEGARDAAATVVFVHGYGLSHVSFSHQIRSLRNDFRVVALDLPGLGESDRPLDFPYSWTAMAEALEEVLMALQLGPVHLVGHSMGGALSILLAHRGRIPIRSLTVIAPYVYGHSMELPRSLRSYRLLRTLIRHAPRRAWETFMARAYGKRSALTPSLLDFYWDRFQRPGSDVALARMLLTLHQPHPIMRAARGVGPMLVVWGDLDALVPASHGRRLVEEGEGRRLVLVDGGGHCVHEEQPERVEEELRAWWQEH